MLKNISEGQINTPSPREWNKNILGSDFWKDIFKTQQVTGRILHKVLSDNIPLVQD